MLYFLYILWWVYVGVLSNSPSLEGPSRFWFEVDDALLKQKLEDEALSDKLSSSIESEDASLKESELGGGDSSDNILSSSMERDNLLKQSKLEGGTQSDNKTTHSA